ncbi:hypothetical protein [Glutamicibacter ardleyensis]|uniref:hypothetical protein n=1 Tax=Glutamicibacter ardleyensis TaxID=225894 RepID=UPI003FD2AFB1
MSTAYTLTLNPTAYQVETSDGTSINADSMDHVEKILRSYKRGNQNNALHLVMDRAVDVPWAVDAFTVVLDAQNVVLEPVTGKIDPAQRRQAVTLRLTGYTFDNGSSFTTFEQAVNAGHSIASRKAENENLLDLYLVSTFPALDGITIPAPEPEEQPVEDSQTNASGELQEEIGLSEDMDDELLLGRKPEGEAPTDTTTSELAQGKPVKESENQSAGEPASKTTQEPVTNAAATFASRMDNRKTAAAPAQEGWRGSMNRTLNTKLAPGPHEQTIRSYRAGVQKSLSAHRTLAMGNIKGGAAKSTSVYLLCAVLGRFRGGNILYWDNNENAGNIVDRAIVPEGREVKAAVDLYQDIDQFENAELSHLLKRYVLMQGDNRFYLLPSQNEAGTKQVIDGAAFDRMYGILRRFYDLMLVDTGNASNSGPWEASIAASDQVIIAASNAEDGFRGSLKTIDALEEQGYHEKLANSVVVFSEKIEPKYAKRSTEEFVQELRSYVRDVVVIPFDKGLIHGGKIEFEVLQIATQEAYLQAAAAIVDGLR